MLNYTCQILCYSDNRIKKRVRRITIRDELTNEWKKRGVKEEKDYAILTEEISRSMDTLLV